MLTVRTEVDDLSPTDFHVFEDGKEVRIASASLQVVPAWSVPENGTYYCEGSFTSEGMWDSPDATIAAPPNTVPCRGLSKALIWDIYHDYGYVTTGGHVYMVSFLPHPYQTGSCHKIAVKVDRPKVLVRARTEYCDASSPSDPLGGTGVAKHLEEDLASGRSGKIALEGQAGVFLPKTHSNNVDIALEFPWAVTKLKWDGEGVSAPVGIVGVVYRKDGSLAERFSDPGLSAPGYSSSFMLGGTHNPPASPIPELMRYLASSVRYERQIALAPGDYDLRIGMTNGHEFGSVDIPLEVVAYDPSKLFLTNVILCKRSHKPAEALGEAEYRPKAFVPLMSRGVEFTPAGDLRFRKGEHLIAWFEIAMPHPVEPAERTVTFKLVLVSLATGKVVVDSGVVDAAPYVLTDHSTFDVAKEIGGFDKLPPGAYRIDVEALDQTGGNAVQSSTALTIE